MNSTAKPPSTILKELFRQHQITDEFVENAAKAALLSPSETRIWLQHLTTVLQNRRRGAAKTVLTRQRKKRDSQDKGLPCMTLNVSRNGDLASQDGESNPIGPEGSSSSYLDPPDGEDPKYSGPTDPAVYCGACEVEYEEDGNIIDFWVGCDHCDNWYCCICECLSEPPQVDVYICKKMLLVYF